MVVSGLLGSNTASSAGTLVGIAFGIVPCLHFRVHPNFCHEVLLTGRAPIDHSRLQKWVLSRSQAAEQ